MFKSLLYNFNVLGTYICGYLVRWLTFITSSRQDEADGPVFFLLVLWVWWEGLRAVVERGRVLDGGANHGAGVAHGRGWGLVLDLPIIRHFFLSCSHTSPIKTFPEAEKKYVKHDFVNFILETVPSHSNYILPSFCQFTCRKMKSRITKSHETEDAF